MEKIMGWVKFSERRPEHKGYYSVLRCYVGKKCGSSALVVPPYREIGYLLWDQKMKLEEEFADRCIYRKYKCFTDEDDFPVNNEEILYWYEIDPIPNDEIWLHE
jgi:hypothetical protein